MTLVEVKDYLHDKTRSAYTIALGVFLCITSCCGYMMDISWNWRGGIYATCFMFLMIATAVGLFMYSSFVMGKWKFLKQKQCSVDFATAEYVHNRRESFRVTHAMMITIGVILCILSVLPIMIVGSLFSWSSGDTGQWIWCSTYVCIYWNWCFFVCGSRKCKCRNDNNPFFK